MPRASRRPTAPPRRPPRGRRELNKEATKEDIALYLLEQEVDQAMATVRGNARLGKAPLDEKLFALVHAQLDYLAPHERFIGAAFMHALKPGSKLGVFSPAAQALQFRYLAFVQELIDEAIRRGEI